jgi:hypothetical protein
VYAGREAGDGRTERRPSNHQAQYPGSPRSGGQNSSRNSIVERERRETEKRKWNERRLEYNVHAIEPSHYKIKLKRAISVAISPDSLYACFLYEREVHTTVILRQGQSGSRQKPEKVIVLGKKEVPFIAVALSNEYLVAVDHDGAVRVMSTRNFGLD